MCEKKIYSGTTGGFFFLVLLFPTIGLKIKYLCWSNLLLLHIEVIVAILGEMWIMIAEIFSTEQEFCVTFCFV